MYFCPCSCSKADCETEEDVLICLPRNLSYAGESYLDRYSVSSAFVHNPKLEKQLLQADVQDGYLKAGAACAQLRKELREEGGEEEAEEKRGEKGGGEKRGEEEEGESSDSELLVGARAMARPLFAEDSVFRTTGGPDSCDDVSLVGEATPFVPTTMSFPSPIPTSSSPLSPPPPQLTVTIQRDKSSSSSSEERGHEPGLDGYVVTATVTESPDSDLVSEEGIFVNMMDDLDGLGSGPGGKSTMSEASDDTYVSGDSMYYSPQEVEEMGEEDPMMMMGDHLRVSLEEAVQQAAFTFHPPSSPPESSQHHPDHSGVEDNNGLVLSLPLPHANDGESKTERDHTTDRANDVGEKDVKPEDCAINSEGCVTTSDNDSGSEATPTPNTTPAVSQPSAKNAGGLEIHLTDMSVVPDVEEKGPLSSSYHDLLSPNSPLYEDREFNFHRTELRKSTSLKSTKTPPGTPRRKKVVRFADAMGLDLESVRHVLNLESPPKIPPSAMKDLQPGLNEDRKAMGSKFIAETFAQPGADPRFRDRVMADKVVLENALVVSGSITGVVRVANVAYHKAVRVRFTTNGWASFHDIAASYMANSNDGPTDRFSFTLVPPPEFCPGSRLEFAISFSAGGVDYWDNNYGTNYIFECYAKTVPTEAENAWMHFL